jgi:hypothetical protein
LSLGSKNRKILKKHKNKKNVFCTRVCHLALVDGNNLYSLRIHKRIKNEASKARGE